MFRTFWSKGAAVFTQLQDTAIRVVAFPSSKPPGRKRIMNNLGIQAQRRESDIWVQRNRNGNLRDPFFPFRRSNCCCPVWAICVLHTSPSNLTRNGSSTKNLRFILLKDAFLERCDTASMSTNKNPTEKCCLFFFPPHPPLRALHKPPLSHDPVLLPTFILTALPWPPALLDMPEAIPLPVLHPTQHFPPQTTTAKVNLHQPDCPTPPVQ